MIWFQDFAFKMERDASRRPCGEVRPLFSQPVHRRVVQDRRHALSHVPVQSLDAEMRVTR